MSTQSEVDRHRKSVQDLQKKIAQETTQTAAARTKATKAQQAASKSSSSNTARSKLREVEREIDKANAAEKQRGKLETQLAAKQKQLYDAEGKLQRKQTADQERAMTKLQSDVRRQESQFRPTMPTTGIPAPTPSSAVQKRDIFISHASEDKAEVALPLAEKLTAKGITVWIDKQELTVGDSLWRKINEGLAASTFGVVILSSNFFSKQWPQEELEGLAAKEHSTGEKVILPIWHHISKDEVTSASPILAQRLALNTSVMSLDQIVEELIKVVHPS